MVVACSRGPPTWASEMSPADAEKAGPDTDGGSESRRIGRPMRTRCLWKPPVPSAAAPGS